MKVSLVRAWIGVSLCALVFGISLVSWSAQSAELSSAAGEPVPLPRKLIQLAYRTLGTCSQPLVSVQDFRDPASEFLVGELERLREVQPRYIFVGNSVLATRLTPAVLEERLGQGSVHKFAPSSSDSTIWYLFLKNVLIPSGIQPKLIFVFFRYDNLTAPCYWHRYNDIEDGLNGCTKIQSWSAQLGSVSHQDEPEFEEVMSKLALHSNTCSSGRIGSALGRLEYWGRSLRQEFSTIALGVAFFGRGQDMEPASARRSINRIFALGQLRRSARAPAEYHDPWRWDELDEGSAVYRNIEHSFLPHILRLARRHKVGLVFVRGKVLNKTLSTVVEDNSEMVNYLEELNAYLENRGAYFYDFSRVPEVRPDMFRDRLHLKEGKQEEWTRIFLSHLEDLFNDFS